jgi:hypothetical protein
MVKISMPALAPMSKASTRTSAKFRKFREQYMSRIHHRLGQRRCSQRPCTRRA